MGDDESLPDKEKDSALVYLKMLGFVRDLTYAIEADWDPYLGPDTKKMEAIQKKAGLLDQLTTSMSRLPQKDVEEGMKLLKVEDVMES